MQYAAPRVTLSQQQAKGLVFGLLPSTLAERLACRQSPLLLNHLLLACRLWVVGRIAQPLPLHLDNACRSAALHVQQHLAQRACKAGFVLRPGQHGFEKPQRSQELTGLDIGIAQQTGQLGVVQIVQFAVALQVQVLGQKSADVRVAAAHLQREGRRARGRWLGWFVLYRVLRGLRPSRGQRHNHGKEGQKQGRPMRTHRASGPVRPPHLLNKRIASSSPLRVSGYMRLLMSC